MQITPDRLLRGSLLTVVYLLGILGIAASGGGGGGGGDDGPTSISYSGNTDPAVISRSNAARLVGNVLVGQTIVGSSSGGAARGGSSIDTATQGIGLAQFPGRLIQKLRNAMQSSSSLLSRSASVRARTDVDETEPCDNSGGSVHITGFIEDNGTGTLTLDYINCREGEETLDGTVTAQINAFDFGFFIPTDAIYNFAILTITSSTINASLSGSIHSQISIGTETEQLTVDKLVGRNNATGEMLMIRNQVSVIDYDNIFSPSSFSETITGRIYDSTHGYVDFSTIVAITFSTITQEYPDSGQLLLIGSLNSGIQVTVISNTHTSLDLDLDGDTTFEIAHTVSWAEIEVETDLIDTDDDGMHDSWEQANGLDPNNSEDINLDSDIDGASNIEEYRGGADPNDSGSIPTSADLSVDMTAFPAAVLLGDSLIYNITVRNNGPNDVNDVVVEDTLPVGMTLNSVTPSQGTCIGTSIITCNIGLMIDNSSATIDIVATPTSEGVVTNSVIVTSGTLDLDPTNNIATMSGGAGSSASVIQAQIDAATDGDSILVAPGVYIGTINISGKNITVASEQGPLVTVIDGNRLDTVVTINSNNSTLEGFTIQNGTNATVGGGGIEVGAGAPTILNNIVANNLFRGIELAFTSAVVRQNTIRNNSRGGILIRGAGSAVVIDNFILNNFGPSSSLDAGGISMNAAGTPTIQDNTINGNTGGAISMGNLSDALILQNIISNNSGVNCGGIEWLVPSSGDGPRVINNTIVYNDGGQGSAICADGFDAQTLLVNNIIVAKAGQTAIYCGDFNSLESPMVEFNNVYASLGMGYGGICTDQSGINGNFFGDPLFIDITNEGYQLRATSPSIDVGDNAVPEIPALDIVGNTRFVDGDQNGSTIVDMGAYEYIR
jgi:uncharacterized repeat protein (TIGR01451 family)